MLTGSIVRIGLGDVAFVRVVVAELADAQVHVALVQLAAVPDLTAAGEGLAGDAIGRGLRGRGIAGVVGGEEPIVAALVCQALVVVDRQRSMPVIIVGSVGAGRPSRATGWFDWPYASRGVERELVGALLGARPPAPACRSSSASCRS